MVAGEIVRRIIRQRKANLLRFSILDFRFAIFKNQKRRKGMKRRMFALVKAEKPMAIPAKAIFLYNGLSSIRNSRKMDKVFKNVAKDSMSRTPSWI
jgi:hypothetical protein